MINPGKQPLFFIAYKKLFFVHTLKLRTGAFAPQDINTLLGHNTQNFLRGEPAILLTTHVNKTIHANIK
jgi:hypothetical protein